MVSGMCVEVLPHLRVKYHQNDRKIQVIVLFLFGNRLFTNGDQIGAKVVLLTERINRTRSTFIGR